MAKTYYADLYDYQGDVIKNISVDVKTFAVGALMELCAMVDEFVESTEGQPVAKVGWYVQTSERGSVLLAEETV